MRCMRKPKWPEIMETLAERGWTQAQLAARVGCSQSTLSDIATGVTAEPRYSIARVLIAMVDSGGTPRWRCLSTGDKK